MQPRYLMTFGKGTNWLVSQDGGGEPLGHQSPQSNFLSYNTLWEKEKFWPGNILKKKQLDSVIRTEISIGTLPSYLCHLVQLAEQTNHYSHEGVLSACI